VTKIVSKGKKGMKIKQMHPFLRLVLSAVLFVVVLMGLHNMLASVRTVKRASKLERMVRESEFAVVLFYRKGRKRIADKALRQKIRDQIRDLRSASNTSPYRYAGVDFYSVDVAKRQDLADAAKLYRAQPAADNVAFALFKTGQQVTSRFGFMSPGQISDFIDQYLKDDIDEIVERKDEKLARKKQEAEIRAYNRSYRYPYWGAGWGWGYGWPYYRRWYWGRPYWGGWGWRGGWRGGRRCHRCR